MFLGTHTPRLDDKGRLILPAKFRAELADGLVVTRGQERCLYVFAMDEFVRIADQMRTAPVTSNPAGTRRFRAMAQAVADEDRPQRPRRPR